MHFAHAEHKATSENVRGYLYEIFDDKDLFNDQETGHFYLAYGSTVLELSVEPYGPEDSVVIIMAYCVQDVEVSEELMRKLLEVNHTLSFGAFSLVGEDIFFQHTLFGRTLERANLLSAIAAVAEISDEYDDKIVARYGGERALDKIRQTGGKQARRESMGR